MAKKVNPQPSNPNYPSTTGNKSGKKRGNVIKTKSITTDKPTTT